ncbi:hypothetical protein SCHPADRAFT_996793 [Schizopora paradoxa]|uniref:Zinc-ribbon 15 domain-containing protein n=1 Tax=Schizopora paradoxa TaxID=27342 RepID=A0A0H2RRH0_9AGAM|nr:hypothetical protein SCHPADRAFT_996793 [Schizopora paradoxa]
MDFICIPLVWGCPTKISQEGDPQMRVCPRCHNVAVYQAKSRTWFEFCWVPLIPFSSSHIWKCNICNWEVKRVEGQPEPQLPGFQQQPYMSPPQPGYQPGYMSPQPMQAAHQPSYTNQGGYPKPG